MKIIKPNAVELKQTDLFKHIELCGRTCYKSEDKITDDSCNRFVNMLREHAHGAMLEHGTVYLTVPNYLRLLLDREDKFNKSFDILRYNQYTKINNVTTEDGDIRNWFSCITTNYRVIVENNLEDFLEKYQSECTGHHYKRRTFKITCNRGVSHEFVRHRAFSFAQESQRYCNYSKDKYGKEITFIEPIWQNGLNIDDSNNSKMVYDWEDAMENAESTYFYLLECGLTPQLARGVLPNDTKTELIMTGFESDWEHFFQLRCAEDAHPEAKYLADIIKNLFNS